MLGTGLAPKNVYIACEGALKAEVLRTRIYGLRLKYDEAMRNGQVEKAAAIKAEAETLKIQYEMAINS